MNKGGVMPRNPWKTLGRKIVYQSPFLTVRECDVIRPDGKPGSYNVVTSGRSNVIIPVTDNGLFYIIGQWRYPTDHYSWEFPGGRIEGEENLIEAAKRELLEEAGLIAKSWKNIGFLDLLGGDHDDVFDVLVAEGVEHKEGNGTNFDCIDQIKIVTLKELFGMIGDSIKNAQSIAALLFYLRAPEIREKYSTAW